MTSLPNIDQWLAQASRQLQAAGISTARLDCLVLLEDCLNTDRTQLLAHGDQKLSREQFLALQTQIEERSQHQPLAYIRGKTEFYGRSFMISKSVLEPRPESETMIDLLKKLPLEWERTTIIDVGTGSGALAITAALELPLATLVATDIDPACLAVAGRNAKALGTKVSWHQTDLIKDIELTTPSVIMANLPYVPNDHQLNRAALNEPRLAIFGGPDGLDLYRQLFKQLSEQQQPPEAVLTESLPFQHQKLAELAGQHGFNLKQTQDFIQVFGLPKQETA
jgi:release factor glutamine methyltransferase